MSSLWQSSSFDDTFGEPYTRTITFLEGIIASSGPEGEKINTKLDVTSLDQLQAEIAAVQAGQPRPKRTPSTVFYKGREVERIVGPRGSEKKKPTKKSPKPKGPKNFSEQRARYATILDTIDTLFRFNKASADPRDGATLYGHLRELPGSGDLSEQLDAKGAGIKLAQSLLDQPKLPAINVDFWRQAKRVLNGRTVKEGLPTFWEEYTDEYGVTEPSIVHAKLPGANVPRRGPGRPPAQPKGGVDSITRSRPLEVPTIKVAAQPDLIERETEVPHSLPSSPLDREGSTLNPYVGRSGFERFYQEQLAKNNNPEPKLTQPSLFSRPGDTRRELEAWKADAVPDPSELPHGWKLEDGKIDLPDGRRIIMDLDSHKLGIMATKKAGHETELAKWSGSREENERLLETQFPTLGEAAREKIIDQLSKKAFERKMAQIDEWFEQDEFDHPLHVLKLEIGKSAVELAEAQKKAERLFRGKGAKLAFETAQTEYFLLQKRYLEAMAQEYEGQPDTAERDAAMFEQIIGMNQAVEDAKSEMLKGARTKFRQFWQKHPKSRIAVGAALTAAGVASAASGFLPGTVASMAIKKAMGAYGTYVGVENTTLGVSRWRDKRKEKKAMSENANMALNIEETNPELAEKIFRVLDHTKDNETRSFVLSHLGVMNEYVADPSQKKELRIFEELVDIQQTKLQKDTKSRRLAKGLGLIASGVVTSVGWIPWHHEAAGTVSSGNEIGKAAGRYAQEHTNVTSPNGTVLTTHQVEVAQRVFGDWTPDKRTAFDAMYKILGENPTQQQIDNFNNLFPVA